MHDICLDHLQRRRVAIVAAARVSTNGEFVSFEAPDRRRRDRSGNNGRFL